jgi:GNAT superfamily N-acetyltransferase
MNDNLNRLQFEGFNKKTGGRLEARHGDETVGYLTWKPSTTGDASHLVRNVWTDESHRQQGIASHLWSKAQADYGITIGHDRERSALGDAWTRKVGGPTPAGDVEEFTATTGDSYQLRYRNEDLGERKPRHIVEAYHGGTKAGELNWSGTSGAVHHVDVQSEHTGRGVGSAMWDHAQGLKGVRKPKGTAARVLGREDLR